LAEIVKKNAAKKSEAGKKSSSTKAKIGSKKSKDVSKSPTNEKEAERPTTIYSHRAGSNPRDKSKHDASRSSSEEDAPIRQARGKSPATTIVAERSH
jgi:hypothetical protein